MDPLKLLREYTMRGELSQVTQVEDQIDFGDRYTFPASSLTGYKSLKGDGEHYTLQTVLFFLKSPDKVHSHYMRMAREAGHEVVSLIDAADMKAYLTGEKDSSEYIDITMVGQAVPVPSARAAGGEPSAKRRRGAEDADARSAKKDAGVVEVHPLHEIYQRERELRDRNSQLVTPNKDLSKVLELLKALEKSKQGKAHSSGRPAPPRSAAPPRSHHREAAPAPAPARAAPQAPKPTVAPLPIKPSGRFDRDDMQQAAMKDINKLGINMYGLHQQPAAAEPASVRPRAPPPRSGRPEHPGPARPSSAAPSRHAPGSHGGARPAEGGASKGSAVPIIIVSGATSAKINMLNARSFLEDGVFKTSEECKAEGIAREAAVTIKRTVDRKAPVAYQVTDKLPPVTSPDWKRVVAVFVQGAAWQFKGFPEQGAKGGDLVETFSRYLGFYLHFHNEKVPDLVKGWKVEKMLIHRVNRHNDGQIARYFWRKLDAMLAEKKSKLAY
eukprot:jgi/Tetstr1/458278/TSEL_044764.t1